MTDTARERLLASPWTRRWPNAKHPGEVYVRLEDAVAELETLERRATAAESVLAEIAEGTESDRIGRYDLLRDWVHTKARSLSEARAALEASRGSA